MTKGLKATWAYSYHNGDWAWKDEDNYWHLMRFVDGQWVEMTKGLKATWVGSCSNGDWAWIDEDKYWHLMRFVDGKWIELTKGLKATWVGSCSNGDWGWKDEDGECHEVKANLNNENKTMTLKEAIAKYGEDNVWKYSHGDWKWKDEDNYWHLMRFVDGQWIELTKELKATGVYSYPNGGWAWKDEDNYWHLMRFVDGQWIELTKELKATGVYSYPNGGWAWKDEDGEWHERKSASFRNQKFFYQKKLSKAITFDTIPMYPSPEDENYSGTGIFVIHVPGKYLFKNGEILLLEEKENDNIIES
jgi:hypothetical protein